jgi:hypothetical protein
MNTEHEPVLACNLEAIPQARRAEHEEIAQHVFAAVQEMRELPTGYALRLPNESDMLQKVIAFISDERLCCPFFHFDLDIAANKGPVWLSLTGATDVKPFLQSLVKS